MGNEFYEMNGFNSRGEEKEEKKTFTLGELRRACVEVLDDQLNDEHLSKMENSSQIMFSMLTMSIFAHLERRLFEED